MHTFPAQLDDVNATLDWVKQHGEEHGLDHRRIVMFGRSSGGHLALLTSYRRGDPAIKGVVALYPPSDLDWGWDNPSNPAVIDTRGTLTHFIGAPRDEAKAQYEAASPIRFVGGAPPTLLLHGGRDALVKPEQSRRMHKRLAQRGVRHMLIELPWANHGFEANWFGPSGQITSWSVDRFLDAVMPTKRAER
jgi:acetyl esterase/lipase